MIAAFVTVLLVTVNVPSEATVPLCISDDDILSPYSVVNKSSLPLVTLPLLSNKTLALLKSIVVPSSRASVPPAFAVTLLSG